MKILVIDVGGTHVKVLVTGHRDERKVASGPSMTAQKIVKAVKKMTADWPYDAVSIGYPGPVLHGKPVCEPHNLGGGWVHFNFHKAFGKPVKIINDAAMQALGSYRGGRMLFLGLGTGLGAALIVDGRIEPTELAHLPYKKRTYEDYVGLTGLKRSGAKKWRRHVAEVATELKSALEADDLVIGGGNAKLLKSDPDGARIVDNTMAFVGGFRLWADSAEPKKKPSRRAARPSVERKSYESDQATEPGGPEHLAG
jgi:polyphosphate glucokinase